MHRGELEPGNLDQPDWRMALHEGRDRADAQAGRQWRNRQYIVGRGTRRWARDAGLRRLQAWRRGTDAGGRARIRQAEYPHPRRKSPANSHGAAWTIAYQPGLPRG